MRIKNGFEIRNICGENIVIAHGVENINFTRVITLNETAAFLWQKLEGKDFTAEEMVEILLYEYEVDKDIATQDVNELVKAWKQAGLVME